MSDKQKSHALFDVIIEFYFIFLFNVIIWNSARAILKIICVFTLWNVFEWIGSRNREEYTGFGAVTEFKFSEEIGRAFMGHNQLKWLQTWGPAWDMLPSNDAFVFVDNHDNQRSDNANVLTYKSRQQYIMAVAFMLAHPYGKPRVMSSFKFSAFDQGAFHIDFSFV